jgi:hypothetical protein
VLLQGNQTVNGTLREEQTSPAKQYTFNETGNYMLRIHNVQDTSPSDVVNIPLQVTTRVSGRHAGSDNNDGAIACGNNILHKAQGQE